MGSGLTILEEKDTIVALEKLKQFSNKSDEVQNLKEAEEQLNNVRQQLKTVFQNRHIKENFSEQHRYKTKSTEERLEYLRNLDPFILDNSIRETTVAQPRGHSLQNKHDILNCVRKTGIENIIVGALGRLKRVDNIFLESLAKREVDRSQFYLFTEAFDSINEKTKLPCLDIPRSLTIAKEYGIPHVVIEIDLATNLIDWDSAFAKETDDTNDSTYLQLLKSRVEFVRKELSAESKIFFNFRDFMVAMEHYPDHVLRIAKYFANFPKNERIMGFCLEDPYGALLPFQLEKPISVLRRVMDDNGWEDGHLLIHIHKNYGLAEASVLEAMTFGLTGVWCGIPDEGAAVGHSCSCVFLTNLARLGNKTVLQKYNFPALRQAARDITMLTTGSPPHPRTEIYGDRALDIIFQGVLTANDPLSEGFDISKLFGTKPKTRISTMATPQMHRDRLIEVFGEESKELFTDEVCEEMVRTLHEDKTSARMEEYDSMEGLFSLYERSGGQISPVISKLLEESKSLSKNPILLQLQNHFDEWDYKDSDKDGYVTFDNFYDAFLSKYLTCYSCEQASKLFEMCDLNKDGLIHWHELKIRANWALTEYPQDISTVDDLIAVIMQKYFLPELLETMQAKKDGVKAVII